jgi:hypothetical protein
MHQVVISSADFNGADLGVRQEFAPLFDKYGVGPVNTTTGKRPSLFEYEDAPWSAVRDRDHFYGFASFDVDPGYPGGYTTIGVTYYDSLGSGRTNLVAFERFTLRKRRSHLI